jgi:hypothetical protein
VPSVPENSQLSEKNEIWKGSCLAEKKQLTNLIPNKNRNVGEAHLREVRPNFPPLHLMLQTKVILAFRKRQKMHHMLRKFEMLLMASAFCKNMH